MFVADGLDRLLKERGGFPFDVDEELLGKPHNQIVKLKVLEEDVVYWCWSILRDLPWGQILEGYEGSCSAQTGFKGAVLVAENARMYGDNFGTLALAFSRFSRGWSNTRDMRFAHRSTLDWLNRS